VVSYSFADGSTDPWVKAQLKAFSGWINSSLNENVVREQHFALDLSNGVVLLRLLQALETKAGGKGQDVINSVRFHRVPRNRYHYIENFQIILKFLSSQGTQLVNQDPHALSDESRNLKVILGLIWKIIQRYSLSNAIGLVKPGGESKSNFGVGAGTSACPPSGGGAPSGGAGYESDQDSYKMSPAMRKQSIGFTSANDVMLFWLNNILMSNPEAVGVRVKDFGNSMADGIVFVHLVNALIPGTLDTIMLRTKEPKEALLAAFEAAETIMGIPQLLDADMISSGTRDPQSIMTYVSLFRNYESSMAKASSSSSGEDDESKAAAAAAAGAAAEKLIAQQAEAQRKAEDAEHARNSDRIRKEQEAQEAELATALEAARISAEAEEKRRQAELDEEKELAEIESSRQAAQAAEALRIAKEKQVEADRLAVKVLDEERLRLQQEEEERAKYVRPSTLSPSQLVDYDANVSTFSIPTRFSIYIENISNNVASVARKSILLNFTPSGGISGALSWQERDNSGKAFGEALSLPLHWITDIVRGNSAHVFRSLIAGNAQPANCLTIIAEEITPDNEKEISRVYLEAENYVDITTLLRRLQVILAAHDRILTIPDLNAPTGTFSVTQAPTLNDSKTAAAKENAAQDEVVKILKKGMVFSRYRVHEATGQPVKESTFVFYHEEEGIGSGGICWCEVGEKTVNPDNYLPLKLISAIYCGKKQPMLKAPIAEAAQDDRCLSIICKKKTVGINEIHLEASTKANLQLWLKGLTTLLSRGGKTVKEEIQKSLEKMYKGRPFICYEDKGSNIIIPRGVFVFYTAPSATAVLKGELGSINWCPQGQRVAVSGCSIQLDHITDIFLGKTGRVLGNEVAAKAAPDCCCSIVARHKSLHLQAESKDMMLSWIAGINHLLAASGKRIKQETNSNATPNSVANVDDVLGSSVYLAAADGDFATLQNALKNTASPNQRDLDFALFKCTVDLQARKVCLLLGAGANPNVKDAGQTPLHRALMFAALADVTSLEMIIRLLISRGADAEAKDEEGKTAASYIDGLDSAKATVIKSAFTEKRTFDQMTAAVMMERRPSFSKRMSLSANP